MPTVTVHPVAKLSVNEEDKARLYYSRSDLQSMSCEVKAIIKMPRELSNSSILPNGVGADTENNQHKYIIGLEGNFAHRGLELYRFPARAINKLLTTRAIMKYHRVLTSDSSLSDSEKSLALGEVSAKLSRWSHRLAVETARQDTIRSFGDDYLIPISEPIVDSTPIPEVKRRRVTCDDDVSIRS